LLESIINFKSVADPAFTTIAAIAWDAGITDRGG
jgi:hypothetical protein